MLTELLYIGKPSRPYANKKSVLPGQFTTQEERTRKNDWIKTHNYRWRKNMLSGHCVTFYNFILQIMLPLRSSWAVSIFHCPGSTYQSWWTFSEKSFSPYLSKLCCASLCAVWTISNFGHAWDWRLRLLLDLRKCIIFICTFIVLVTHELCTRSHV